MPGSWAHLIGGRTLPSVNTMRLHVPEATKEKGYTGLCPDTELQCVVDGTGRSTQGLVVLFCTNEIYSTFWNKTLCRHA